MELKLINSHLGNNRFRLHSYKCGIMHLPNNKGGVLWILQLARGASFFSVLFHARSTALDRLLLLMQSSML